VTEARLAPAEIEREREALIGQIRGLDDEPFHVANRLLARALYGRHPYALAPSGEIATVARLGREHLARHVEAFYTPDRMVLAVSGDVPAAEVLAETARLFGPAPRGRPSPPPGPLPERPERPRVEERRPTQQAHLLTGFLAPPIGHADHVALKVMNAVLGSGMSSRLFRALRDEAGLAYAVGSFYPVRRAVSRLVVHIGTAPQNLGAAESGIQRVLDELRTAPVPDDELARAKAFLTGSLSLDLRTNARQSFYASFFELMGVGHAYSGRYPELVEAVAAADVQRVARRYLTERSVAVVGPS
jgi:predicted Zn-dependent peptidase